MRDAGSIQLAPLERLALHTGRLLTIAVVLVLLFQSCATRLPRNGDDLCEIFYEEGEWYRGARRSFERWGVHESVQLAFVHQESRFRADARPDWRRVLGVFPVGRLSSAYGYGQVKDGTWSDYIRATGHRGAERDDFADVADFIGRTNLIDATVTSQEGSVTTVDCAIGSVSCLRNGNKSHLLKEWTLIHLFLSML